MKNKKYHMELIIWEDAFSETTWGNIENIKEWAQCGYAICEVGWVIFEDNDNIVLCSQLADDGDIGNRTRIHKKWVKSRKKINLK